MRSINDITHDEQSEAVRKTATGKKFIIGTLLLILVVGLACFFLIKERKKEVRKKELAPVVYSIAKTMDVPVQIRSIGSVIPANSVSVKSRVAGRITAIHFKEGDFVKRKELLFTIDQRQFKAEVLKAESDVLKQEAVISQAEASIEKDKAAILEVKANLNKDLALAKLAEKDAERFIKLAKAGAVSDAEAERREATRESTLAIVSAAEAAIKNAQAQVKADEANLRNAQAQLTFAKATLQNAKIQLNYTTVNAPIEGRTGKILTLRGNNIRPDEDILVTINQIAPIYVEFSVPQEQFQQVLELSQNGSLLAKAALPQGKVLAQDGKVTFTDNTVDSTTGTVKIKALFDNADSSLWPGQYVDIFLTLKTIQNAVVVPSQAVQTGQNGQFVWILDHEKAAHMRKVEVGPIYKDSTSINAGLEKGDEVVIDGQLQLSEGAKVKAQQQE